MAANPVVRVRYGAPRTWFQGRELEANLTGLYILLMFGRVKPPSLAELASLLEGFCQKHGIRRLEVFGSTATGTASAGSDVDLLVTLDESQTTSTAHLLEMAGEAEELVGAPVDFVLRKSLEKSPNSFAREHILGSAVPIYGS